MKLWRFHLSFLVVVSVGCGTSHAIVRQPTNSIERFEVERAYRERSDQAVEAPMTAPLPQVDRQNKPDNTNSVMQVERAQNPQDIGALNAVQKDIRMQNPVFRVMRVVGASLLALGISAFMIWQIWKRLVASQRKKMLEEMRRGQQLAKELRDRL